MTTTRPQPTAAARPADAATARIAFAVMVAFFALAPFVDLPGVPDEGDVLRAVRLRLQPADRLRRPAVVRPRDVPRHGGLRRARTRRRCGACRPSSRSSLGTAAAALLGVVAGLLAIRRQGIYFAMITLALAQMIYFFCLQAPFTHGEDGIQAVPRGQLFGFLDLSDITVDVLHRARDLPRRLPAHLPRHPLAVRPGAEGDPRERAARDLARLRRRPLQAARVRALGDARRARRRDQGDRVPARLADRRALDDVGRGRADDAARRPGHDLRAGRRRVRHHRAWRTTSRSSAPG